jgi:tetratricopeptide (TPR) repeat protein
MPDDIPQPTAADASVTPLERPVQEAHDALLRHDSGRPIAPRPKPIAPDQPQRKRRRRRRYNDWQSSLFGQPFATLLMAALLIGGPQLLGGVLPITIVAIAVLALSCLAWLAFRSPAAERAWPITGAAFVLVWAFTALQATPLPCDAVAAIAPESAAAARAAPMISTGRPPSLCTLTQDPGSTQQELIKGAAIVATFLASWLFAASGGRRRLLWLIALSSLTMSLVALGHRVLELERVFGFYAPWGMAPEARMLAPLMNQNNLGGFIALSVPLWIGLGYRAEDPNVRLLSYVAIAVNTTATVLTLSRGAVGALIVGVLAVVTMIVLQRRRAQNRRRGTAANELGVLFAGTCGALGSIYFVGSELLQEFRNGDMGKLELIGRSLEFALQHPWTGVGRGAFGSAFLAEEGALLRYRYPENFVAQWAAEWGLVTSTALLVVIALALWRGARASNSLPRKAAFAGLGALCLQNLVDFGFETLGVAVIAAALLAACIAPSSEEPGRPKAEAVAPWRRAYALSTLALTFGIVLTAWLGPRLPQQAVNHEEGELLAAEQHLDRPGFRQQLTAAVALHPSEPRLTLLAAEEALAHHDHLAGAWVNRSMQLAPGWARPHHLAFRWLWHNGDGAQALGELRAAAEIDLNTSMEDVCRLGTVDLEWVLRAMPRNDKRRDYLEIAANCLAGSRAGAQLDLMILQEFPDMPRSLNRVAVMLARGGDVPEALYVLDRLKRAHPAYQNTLPERLQILLDAGRLQEVISESDDNSSARLDLLQQVRVLGIRAQALARSGAEEPALEMVSKARRLGMTDAAHLAASYELEGRVRLLLKQPGEALGAYREAYRINAEPQFLRTIAGIAESLGDRAQALWAYINLCQREPQGGGCERRNALLAPPGQKSAR